MKTNFLLHSFSRSYSHHRKNCANKYETMKSCVLKYTASLFTFLLLSIGNAWGSWTLCTSTADFVEDGYYMFVADANSTHYYVKASSTIRGMGYYSHESDSLTAYNSDPTTLKLKDAAWKLIATENDNQWKLQSYLNSSIYLNIGDNNNGLRPSAASTATSYWTITKHATNNTFAVKYYMYDVKTSTDISRWLSAYTTESPYGIRTYKSTNYVKVYKWEQTCTDITPSLSYSSDSIGIGGTTGTPTVTGNTGSGKVTYSSSDGSIATVISSTGVVTGVATGEVTITASIAKNGDYCDGEATATIKVRRAVNYYIGEDSYAVGGKDDQELLSVLPSQPSTCNVFDYPYFYGWKDGSIDGITTTAPTVLSTELVSTSNGKTYYAVFRDWFCWNGGTSSSLTSLSGVTASGLGSDYLANNAPYQVKLDNTGDYIIITTPLQPSSVSIKVKMIGGATESSIKVQEANVEDGEFTDVETMTISGKQNDIVDWTSSNAFASTTRAIKLLFTKGSNVGLGYIHVSGVANANYVTSCGTMYNITLDKNGGDADGSAKVLENTKSLMYITAPTKTGHEVDGYYTTSALTTKIATSAGALQASVTEGGNNWTTASSEWTRGEDETFFANWVPCKYDVTLIKNGSSASNQVVRATYGSAMPDTIKAVGNTSISVPTRTGYTFNGYWDTNESEGGKQYYSYSGEPAVLASAATWDKASNTDLYERWTANVYTVTLDNKKPTTQGVTSVTATYGQLMPELDGDLPTKTGYRFDGYWTTASAGTQYYDAEGTPKVNMNLTSENATLHAHWIPLLTFSVNGVIDDALTCDDNTAMPSSADVPTACGDCWEFVGWSTDSNKSDEPEYAGGDTHQFSSPTTLYAVYIKTEDDTYATRPGCQTYTITWKVSGQVYTTGDPTLETNTCNGIGELPTDPDEVISCSDVFMGWSEFELSGAGHDAPEDLFSTTEDAPIIDNNKTFHAVFATLTDGVTPVAVPFRFIITPDSFVSTSYADNNIDKVVKAEATDDSGYTLDIDWNSYQVMKSSSNIQFQNNAGYIYNKTDLGTVNSVAYTETNGGVLSTFYGSEEHPTNGEQGSGKGFFTVASTKNVKACHVASVTVNFTKNITPKVHVNYQTYCTYTYTDANNDHLWSTAANWSSESVPTINDRATITKPVTVDVATAKAKDIVLDRSGGNTGSLTIPAGKALVVAETVKKTTNGSSLVATTEEDIFIGSNLDYGTGALVMGDHNGTNQATVQFATKAKKTGGHNVNQFIGTPFNDEDYILYDYYNTKIYEFRAEHDGDKGNDNEWIRVSSDAGMTAFMGYNILTNQASSPTLEMTGTLNATNENVAKTLYYKGSSKTENMFANSWMAPIHIDAFSDDGSDFGGAEATIYIFNAGTPEDQGSHSTTDGTVDNNSPGQYIVLPISSTPWVSPTVTVIPSMQAFSVFATGNNQTLTLDYNKLVYTPALTSVGVVPMRAPRRAPEETPEVIRLHVEAESGYAANAYVLGREDFSNGFDNGWDGRFMEGDAEAPQLYIPTEDGNMVISCIPEIEGTLLVFRKGTEDDRYTFSFEYEGEDAWYLNDMLDKRSVLIEQGNTYTFYSYEGDADARFIISASPGYNTPTDIGSGGITEPKARKLLIENQLYIIRAGKMYNATGIMVK